MPHARHGDHVPVAAPKSEVCRCAVPKPGQGYRIRYTGVVGRTRTGVVFGQFVCTHGNRWNCLLPSVSTTSRSGNVGLRRRMTAQQVIDQLTKVIGPDQCQVCGEHGDHTPGVDEAPCCAEHCPDCGVAA